MGFLRVERLLLGADIAAVRICERPHGLPPRFEGEGGCATRSSMRHVLALV
jgi:hypothetical protein